MKDKTFIFLTGLHRSGTSLMHEILREHSHISGFVRTGVPEDEGQHLQSVYKTARHYGGPGQFVFDQNSYMDESHALATGECAQKILKQWTKYYDLSCTHLIEKSPPNLIRTRYFQEIFPNSKFIVILRHPIPVAYATQKWSKTSIYSLIDHTIRAYEIFLDDMSRLDSVFVLRYEEFVCAPQKTINDIFNFIGNSQNKVNFN